MNEIPTRMNEILKKLGISLDEQELSTECDETIPTEKDDE